MFVVIHPPKGRKGGRILVMLRARTPEAAANVVCVAQRIVPEGYRFVSWDISDGKKRGDKSGSVGKRRDVKVRFRQTDDGHPMKTPTARRHFARLWEVSQDATAAHAIPLVGERPAESSPTPRSAGVSLKPKQLN